MEPALASELSRQEELYKVNDWLCFGRDLPVNVCSCIMLVAILRQARMPMHRGSMTRSFQRKNAPLRGPLSRFESLSERGSSTARFGIFENNSRR